MDQLSIINQTKEKINRPIIRKLAKQVLKAEGKSNVELNIIIVDNETITKINQEYRCKEGPTDVITFAFLDTPSIIEYEYELLGEIYISIEQAKIQSESYAHSLDREMGFLVVHGMYHLLGYDHMTEDEAKIMRKKEEVILSGNETTQRG